MSNDLFVYVVHGFQFSIEIQDWLSPLLLLLLVGEFVLFIVLLATLSLAYYVDAPCFWLAIEFNWFDFADCLAS